MAYINVINIEMVPGHSCFSVLIDH